MSDLERVLNELIPQLDQLTLEMLDACQNMKDVRIRWTALQEAVRATTVATA